MKSIFILLKLLIISSACLAQSGSISGKIISESEPLSFANIRIIETLLGTTSEDEGYFTIESVPFGSWTVEASFLGYKTLKKKILLNETNKKIEINFDLPLIDNQLNPIVITGTKTEKRRADSPIIVNVIDSKTLSNVSACNLSEGLRFQPGLRVETDCQTCNYTQLRMNGLGGGYSQILINGRPVFSPLTGLYGMEQLPANMIEQIEIVRGGGSALYGSSAIGGTVNIITKTPTKNAYTLSYTHQSINNQAQDRIINGNASIVNTEKTAGVSLFMNNRKRGLYDHNNDNFSELPEIENNSFGANLFLYPSDNQKLELSLSSLNEYRYGGEMVDKVAHLALQSEERQHNILTGNLDYQINFNHGNSSFIAYMAGQNTRRTHYTGIFPDDENEIQNHLENPPYGNSKNTTFQGGLQLNHSLQNFLLGNNILTFGTEYLEDDILDQIESYNYEIDQVTKNLGVFLQSDWEITPKFSFLTGIRADYHNLVDKPILNPRLSFLHKSKNNLQYRVTWSTGFRAPQAFDADMHIAFAGGGVSRIMLSPDLKEERSNSLSTSISYDKISENFIAGFTVEGFYTHLKDAFYLHPLGEDEFGLSFEKRNGSGATVKGITAEIRANYNQKAQLEAGFTIQSSLYDKPVENSEALEATDTFLRTPNQYGYATLSFFPNKKLNTTLNLVHTSSMKLIHFAGSPEQPRDEYITSPSFTEVSFKVGYTIFLKNNTTGIEFFGGIKNSTNAYQNDFDSGKNRDSNYVYGSSMPRTYYIGIKVKSL